MGRFSRLVIYLDTCLCYGLVRLVARTLLCKTIRRNISYLIRKIIGFIYLVRSKKFTTRISRQIFQTIFGVFIWLIYHWAVIILEVRFIILITITLIPALAILFRQIWHRWILFSSTFDIWGQIALAIGIDKILLIFEVSVLASRNLTNG